MFCRKILAKYVFYALNEFKGVSCDIVLARSFTVLTIARKELTRDLSPKRVLWNRGYIICPPGTAKEFNVITEFIFPHPNTAILARSEP